MIIEIKFRGIPTFGKDFVYGFYNSYKQDGAENGITHEIIVHSKNAGTSRFEVKKETVGQYTGLKDKNGKEIYEGDIVKTHYYDFTKNGQHVFLGEKKDCDNEDCVCLQETLVEEKIVVDLGEILSGNSRGQRSGQIFNLLRSELEIIGNTHTNPELNK